LAEICASSSFSWALPLRLFDLVKHDLEVVVLGHFALLAVDRFWKFARSSVSRSTSRARVQIYG